MCTITKTRSRVLCLFLLALLFAPLASAASKRSKKKDKKGATKEYDPGKWKGPAGFRAEKDGGIVGGWWQGGGRGIVYYTGPHAQKLKAIEQACLTVAKKLKIPYREIHAENVRPSDADPNGALVYPDGTARVQLFVMPGGHAAKTMMHLYGVEDKGGIAKNRKLFEEGRKNPQHAFATGMNYIGMCGGCFAATSGYTVPNSLCLGWALWPGKAKNIGPSVRKPLPDVIFDKAKKDHPLYKATAKGVLKKMFFNGGPLTLQSDIPDTEYFGKYQGGALKEIEGDWFCVAYRPSDNPVSGRLVITTGHPESGHTGFLQAMMEYACDHLYSVPQNWVEAGKAVEAKSGDDQMQYYCYKADADRKLTITLTGLEDNCDLYVRHHIPPTFKKKDSKSTSSGKRDEKVLIHKAKAGTYYIGVHGKHDRLAGAGYTLTVTAE